MRVCLTHRKSLSALHRLLGTLLTTPERTCDRFFQVRYFLHELSSEPLCTNCSGRDKCSLPCALNGSSAGLCCFVAFPPSIRLLYTHVLRGKSPPISDYLSVVTLLIRERVLLVAQAVNLETAGIVLAHAPERYTRVDDMM